MLLLTMAAIISCDPDETEPVNQEELITTVKYTLTPQGGGSTVVLSFRDLDGDGGTAPVITGGELVNGKTYDGVIELLNESKSPAEDIGDEVTEEGVDHQLFFRVSTQELIDAFEYTYIDKDINGYPIGLITTLKTLNVGSGNLILTLRHKPNKGGLNVSLGDITNAGGETDIEVSLPIQIK